VARFKFSGVTGIVFLWNEAQLEQLLNWRKKLNMMKRLYKFMETQFRKDLISALGWLALWIIVRTYVNACAP